MDKKKSRRMQKEEVEWDRKKIVLVAFLIIVLLIIILSFKNSILGTSKTGIRVAQQATISPNFNIKKNAQDQINAIKQEAGNINLVDIATSSPQVQKVINDLKALKDYPNNQLKNACVNLCGRL